MSKYEATYIEDYGPWDELVQSSPSGNVFSESFWLSALAKTAVDDFKIIGVFKGDRLVGGVGLPIIDSLPGGSIVVNPKLTPYNSPVVRPRNTSKRSKISSHQDKTITAISEKVQDDFQVATFINDTSLMDIRPFKWDGWNDSVKYTYIVDIQDTEALWDSVNSNVRSRVRKCRDEDVEVEIIRDGGGLRFYDLFKSTFERRDMLPPVSADDLEILFDSIAAENKLHYYVASVDGTDVSALAAVADGKLVHEWQAATDPEYLSMGVAPYLRWEALEDLHESGYEKFDLNGAGIKSVARAKSKFAGSLVPYYETSLTDMRHTFLQKGWDRFGDSELVQKLRYNIGL